MDKVKLKTFPVCNINQLKHVDNLFLGGRKLLTIKDVSSSEQTCLKGKININLPILIFIISSNFFLILIAYSIFKSIPEELSSSFNFPQRIRAP